MTKKSFAAQPDGVFRAKLDDLILWEDNYNQGDVGAIALSIRKTGFNNVPRVWNGLNLRAGNHTVKALRLIRQEGPQAGDRAFPPAHVYVEDGEWYVDVLGLGDLSEAEATAFAIADNRDAALASHDETSLLKHLLLLHEQGDESLLLASGYDTDDMENLRRILGEPVVMTDPYKNPKQALDYYLNGAVKQIVLYFDATTYLNAVERLTRIMEAENLDSNTSTVLHLLEHYEATKGDWNADATIEPQGTESQAI